jgi:signal transduction histidine kinase
MEPDLSAVYGQLVAALRDLLNCSGVAILIPGGSAATVPAQYGPQPLPELVDLDSDARRVLSRLAQAREPLLIEQALPFQPPLPTPASDVAWLGIPICLEDRMDACLSASGRISTSDQRIALVLAQQAAESLRWGQRYMLAQRQTQQTQQLLHLTQQIRQTRDRSKALDQILETTMALTGATHSYVVVSQHGQAAILARRGYSQDEAALLEQIAPSLDRGLNGRAYQTRACVRSDDIRIDHEALHALAGTRSQLIIPIGSADQVLGLIDLQSPQPAAFAALEEALLLALADLAASVLQQSSAGSPAQLSGGIDIVSQHDLLLSSRLAVVTDLAAGVAHEINNPLTTILGYTHLLLRDESLSEQTRGDIGQIVIEGERIAALVERFLRFAQPASSGKRPLAINEPLLEALGLLESRLQESAVSLELDIPTEQLMVLGQAGQLEQAFLDLLQNAIESMSASDKRQITIQASQQGGWVRVAVADSGRGIMPALLTRVFEPGFTTKVDKGISRGLGLGLYAAHTIIQDHWGRIEVQSQIQRGSTFTVCLPAI